ncbi:MAG: hypothetical protein GTO04_04430 [Planctomycetales bacterium]|nr:hypothetical protein [Planctomycetales bacterium]
MAARNGELFFGSEIVGAVISGEAGRLRVCEEGRRLRVAVKSVRLRVCG